MLPAATETELMYASAVITGTTATANLDTRGADFVEVYVTFRSEVNVTAQNPTVTLKQGDTTSAFVTTGLEAGATIDLTNETVKKYSVDMRGKKRWLQIDITPVTQLTNSDVTAHVVANLMWLGDGPKSTTDMVANTQDECSVL